MLPTQPCVVIVSSDGVTIRDDAHADTECRVNHDKIVILHGFAKTILSGSESIHLAVHANRKTESLLDLTPEIDICPTDCRCTNDTTFFHIDHACTRDANA